MTYLCCRWDRVDCSLNHLLVKLEKTAERAQGQDADAKQADAPA
jgi:hypothetical protein